MSTSTAAAAALAGQLPAKLMTALADGKAALSALKYKSPLPL
jgi:hypothetical protein